MRFIEEWKNPALKCERVGHRKGVEFRKGYRKPDYSNGEYRSYVCVAVEEERIACPRCKAAFGEWRVTHRKGFTGYNWPSDQAKEFDKAGEYWTSKGLVSL